MPDVPERWGRRDFSTAPAGLSQTTGEFLPTIVTTTGTITLNALSICRWIIVGSLATFNIHLLVSAISSPTGSFTVRGFPASLTPYNGGNVVQGFMSCAVFGSGMTSAAGTAHLMGEFFNGPPLSLTVSQLSAGALVNIASRCVVSTNFEILASYRVA
jgi:hypothetical protein